MNKIRSKELTLLDRTLLVNIQIAKQKQKNRINNKQQTVRLVCTRYLLLIYDQKINRKLSMCAHARVCVCVYTPFTRKEFIFYKIFTGFDNEILAIL